MFKLNCKSIISSNLHTKNIQTKYVKSHSKTMAKSRLEAISPVQLCLNIAKKMLIKLFNSMFIKI